MRLAAVAAGAVPRRQPRRLHRPTCRYFVASCEFSGKLLVVDRRAPPRSRKVIDLNADRRRRGRPTPRTAMHERRPEERPRPGASAMPQDVRLTPDGRMVRRRRHAAQRRLGDRRDDLHGRAGSSPPGKGAHGIYPSRDARRLYVSNRDEGTVTVLDAATLHGRRRGRSPAAARPTWAASRPTARSCGSPAATTPRSTSSTRRPAGCCTGSPSTAGPHGLCVWPQPGRFSLGHTGNMR